MIDRPLFLRLPLSPGTWLLGAPEWLWPALAVVAVAVALLVWSYWQAGPGGRWRGMALGLKLLGVAALAVCLIEPLLTGTRAKPGANLLPVLADNSRTMRIRDGSGGNGNGEQRGERLRALLERADDSWLDALDEHFRLRRYAFDQRPRRTDDFAELDFRGRSSAIGESLRSTAERYRGRPLAGIVMLTDGNATDLAGGDLDTADLPPVYPVVVGEGALAGDLAVQSVSVRHTAFEDAPVTIRAAIRARGYAGQEVRAELLNADGEPVREQTFSVREDDQTLAARFEWRPEEPGIHFCRVRVRAEGDTEALKNIRAAASVGEIRDGAPSGADGDAPDADASDADAADAERTEADGADGDRGVIGEATLANNARTLMIRRDREPYRVLYLGGRPSWEYKFLRRAVAADEQVQLVGLIRMARREPKFQWRGRAGESSNPLFRGFDEREQAEAERYDQPVLIRLNTEDEDELAGGFPITAEELFAYHAVVIDDMEAEFFDPDQMKLLNRYVSERGGGLLMLGGYGSFSDGGYAETPVGRMLPLYLDRLPERRPGGEHQLGLTRAGYLEPWARLRETEEAERQRLAEMPGFRVINPVGGVKPGANVIATVGEGATEQPAIALQRFGRGRSAAVTVGDVWRWGFRDPDQQEDMSRAWRQMLRRLVVDTPERISLSVERRADRADEGGDANGPVVLRIRARDERFQPISGASASIEVTEPGGETVELRARSASEAPGLLEVPYVPRRSGGYHVRAEVVNGEGQEAGSAEAGFTVDFDAEEFRSLTPNRALLESIASRTGGRVLSPEQLTDFAGTLPRRQAPITEPWTRPLWHSPALFLLALVCFFAEWILRRRRGLP